MSGIERDRDKVQERIAKALEKANELKQIELLLIKYGLLNKSFILDYYEEIQRLDIP